MAARAMWKGTMEVGRTKLPVKLYAAVEDRTVHFHLLEKRTHSRVKQHMVNPETGEEVAREEIRKGYEIDPDTFVVLEDKDLQTLEPGASTSIEVSHFVPTGLLGHQYYDRPYYLGPDGDAKSYFAFAEALARKECEGLAHWVMRKKEYIGALQSKDGYLLLITLRHAEEVVTARDIGSLPGKAPDAREIKMAEQLLAVLEDEFRPEDYGDSYRERVMKHIEAKAKGRKPKLATMPKPAKTPASLMNALTASLKAAGGRKEKSVA